MLLTKIGAGLTFNSHESWSVWVQSTRATPAFQTEAPYVATLDYGRDGSLRMTHIYNERASGWVEIGNINLWEMYSGYDTVQITRTRDDRWFMTPVDLFWILQHEHPPVEDSLMEDAPTEDAPKEDSPMEGSPWL